MRHNRRAALMLLGGAMLLPVASRAGRSDALDLLSRGQAVVYFRHGATTWSGVDQLDWPRSEQRLLSELGIAQSRQIGAAFRQNGFPVGEVLASPFARCRDMAEIAFGRVEERIELIGLLSDRNGRAGRIAYLQRQLSSPTQGQNRVLISHRSNIAEAAGVSLGEGDGVVIRPTGDGHGVVALFKPEDW